MVVQDHQNWYHRKPICDFLLVFHCNSMPVFYRFQDITIYLLKIWVFRHFYRPVSFRAFTRSLDPGSESWYRKTTCWWKPRDPMVISFDALPTCDGQTDGHAACTNVAI